MDCFLIIPEGVAEQVDIYRTKMENNITYIPDTLFCLVLKVIVKINEKRNFIMMMMMMQLFYITHAIQKRNT